MSDKELVKRLRSYAKDQGGWHNIDDTCEEAADRIEALTAENKRLGQQCEGLMQAGMNNGQALILAEAKLAKAVDALEAIKLYSGCGDSRRQAIETLAELKGEDRG